MAALAAFQNRAAHKSGIHVLGREEIVMSDVGEVASYFNVDEHYAAKEIADIRRPVERTAKPLLLLAVLSFAAVSFVTTNQGFAMMVLMPLALFGAIGLQTTLFVTEVIFSGKPHVDFQKLCAGTGLLLTGAISVFFSYAGIRHGLNADIAKVQEPFILERTLADDDSLKTTGAIQFKGKATAFLKTRELSAEAALERTRGQYQYLENRTRQAFTKWRQEADQLDGIVDHARSAQIQANERVAARRYTLLHDAELRAASAVEIQRSSLRQLEDTLREIRQFAPNFTGLAPAAKERALATWISAWSGMPRDFQVKFPMPGLSHPSGPVVPPGREESILGAVESLRHPTPTDGFALLVAFLLDFLPALAILSTGASEHLALDSRIRAARGWMRRVWQEAQLSEGLLPWSARLVRQVIYGKPASLDDPDFRKFAAAMDALDVDRQAAFARIAMPEAIKQRIGSALQQLHARLQTLAFRRSSEMTSLVDLGIAGLIGSVMNSPELSTAQRAELTDFLQQQINAFDDAVGNLNPSKKKET